MYAQAIAQYDRLSVAEGGVIHSGGFETLVPRSSAHAVPGFETLVPRSSATDFRGRIESNPCQNAPAAESVVPC